MPDLYLDDFTTAGVSPETSHPAFRALAPGPWIYDTVDDCTPFGYDAGFDAFWKLTCWVQDGADIADAHVPLRQTMDEWAIEDPPDLDRKRGAELTEIVGSYLFPDLMDGAHMRIAVTLGQFKISGAITPTMRAEGLLGIRCFKAHNALAREATPELMAEHEQDSSMTEAIEIMLNGAPPMD